MDENQMKLPNGRIITFNDEQIEGLYKIRAWLKNSATFFTLAGYAGTGKTTIIKKILDGYMRKVAVSAPTHKAKKVIIATTHREGVTLHSLLGLRPDLDLDSFNPNDPQFKPIAKPKINSYDFIIIDESSMINAELFELLKFTTKDLRTKILFMGDPAQIPPIGERESVVFFDSDIEIHWLRKVERQNDGNPLLTVYDELRNHLTQYDAYEKITNINSNGEGIIFLDKKPEFRKAVLDKFLSDQYTFNSDFAKIIAWQNTSVMASNKVIREAMFREDAKVIETGDVLMAYRSIMAKLAYYNIIDNSADYRVLDVGECEENEYGIWGYRVTLKENFAIKDIKVFMIDSHEHKNLHYYADMHDFFKIRAVETKALWKDYYNFRRENMCMVTIKEYEDGTARANSEIIGKDFDYGYALTAHKCQGSTYNHVLILENDIDCNSNIKERNQIKYVAMTRPTLSATLLIN